MPLQYTEAELANLIKSLESEFTKELNKAEVLAKAEDGEKKDKKPSEDKEKDSAPPAESKPADENPAAEGSPAEEAAESPAEEAAEQAAAPAPAADAAAAPGHGYDDEDMAHMQQMYESMSKEELMAHHDAVRAALDAKMAAPAAGAPAPAAPDAAMGKSEKPAKSELADENPELNSKPKAGGKDMNSDAKNGAIEGQKPSGPKGARSEASKDSKNLKDAMTKAERQDRNGGKIEKTPGPKGSPGAQSEASKDQGNLSDMEKSEKTEFDLIKSELEAEKAKSADLKKNLDTVQAFLTKLVTKVSAPKGKAITEISALQKNEGEGQVNTSEMSKHEITAKLLAKSQDPACTPADRAAINNYYLSGANVNTISHLLK